MNVDDIIELIASNDSEQKARQRRAFTYNTGSLESASTLFTSEKKPPM